MSWDSSRLWMKFGSSLWKTAQGVLPKSFSGPVLPTSFKAFAFTKCPGSTWIWGMRWCMWFSIRDSMATVCLTCVATVCKMSLPWVCLRSRYGAPINRRRVYLIMIRMDMLTDEVKNQDFPTWVKKKLDDMKVKTKVGWFLTWIKSLHTSIN